MSLKKTLIPHDEYLLCAKFNFFPWCGFRDAEVQSFSFLPTWLPHHVTYDIIIINKTFYMSSRTNGENLVSIQQALAEKNTDKQMDPNAVPSPLPRVNVVLCVVFEPNLSQW